MLGFILLASSRNATYKLELIQRRLRRVTEKKGKKVEHYEVLKLLK